MNPQASSSTPMDTDNDNSGPKFLSVFEVFNFENTQSNLTTKRPPSPRIPPAKEPNSAFLDLMRMPSTLDGRKIAEAIPDEVIGTKFRADTKFIQLFFEQEEDADKFIKKGTLTTGDHHIPILPPKGKPLPLTLLKIDNVPIMGKKKLTKILTELLADHCCPKEVAPVTIKNTKLLTSRWEAVVEAVPGRKLNGILPPVLEIEGQKILLSWAGSTPTCIQCLSSGHLRRNCPKRAQKNAPVPAAVQHPAPADAPPKQKNYANIVAQKTPENNTYEVLANPLTTEYQGPTSLYEKAPTSDPLTQTPVHGSTMAPVLDNKQSFCGNNEPK